MIPFLFEGYKEESSEPAPVRSSDNW